MLFAVLSGFVLAVFAVWIHRLIPRAAAWLLALLPFGLTLYFLGLAGTVAGGETLRSFHPWVPSLGVNLSFTLDGLSLLFALLISGIGALVVVYSGRYLEGHPHAGRFHAYTLMFMASMLGVVLADNLILLFVFWELTSVSSYLLIGFDHEREKARKAALQALLVTGGGGLALLAGFLLLGDIGGSLDISELSARGEALRGSPRYLPILLLVLLGAFTKSAQFPFHFWLPNAMEAPTPASAYLHAATMVKAGIYLLARLSPVLGNDPAWQIPVTAVGVLTMLAGAWLALQQTYLKLLLAYSTMSALGALTMMLGLGNGPAVAAAVVFLPAHALYKGSLFLVAGSVDHVTGERNVTRLSGLGRSMAVTAAAAMGAAASMAGLPPLLGFLAKENLLGAAWAAPAVRAAFLGAVVLAGAAYVAIAGIVGFRPFVGTARAMRTDPHEAPIALWLGPFLLALLGVLGGMLPGAYASLLSAAASAILGVKYEVRLALWHGFDPMLILSATAVAGGIGLYAVRGRLVALRARWGHLGAWGPSHWYDVGMKELVLLARRQTRLLQSGYLRTYLTIIVITTLALAGHALVRGGGVRFNAPLSGVRFYELSLAILILVAAAATVHSRSRLAAVATLGVVGYGIALLFILRGAPDLAMTQFIVETVTVVLFVLALHHLPPFSKLSTRGSRARDALVALLAGGLMTAFVLITTGGRHHPSISGYFAEMSVPMAHGRNIVNVILVDFRGLDTLGEITVLAVAGIGAYALLKLQAGRRKNP
ncbi:MAG: putative monovalent cation/H+ antiporter subunit A [Deltaproteobacteria bacterium]|nr:putative monovalent cation/H+ antiporter subunit A [Deltaproteobacteria bacterium]